MIKETKENKGITLVALVVTIIVLLILAGIVMSLTIGNQGLFNRSNQAVQEYQEAEVKEKVEMMLGDYSIDRIFGTKTLEQYLNEEKAKGTLEEVINKNDGTIMAIVNGYEVTIDEANLTITNITKHIVIPDAEMYKIGTYEGKAVSGQVDDLNAKMESANTIQINIKEKYSDYKNLTVENFLVVDNIEWSKDTNINSNIKFGGTSTKIKSYNQETGILTIMVCYTVIDTENNTQDLVVTGNTTVYLVKDTGIPSI